MEMKPTVVYGVFTNTGEGREHLWYLGVCLTEQEAHEKFNDYLMGDDESWVDEIKVL